MYFLDPSLLAKHTPLITTASPGNYENPPRINQMQKNGNQKYTVRHDCGFAILSDSQDPLIGEGAQSM